MTIGGDRLAPFRGDSGTDRRGPDRTVPIPEPLTVTALALAGLSAGAAILLVGDTSGRSRDFLSSEGGVAWGTLLCLETAYWAISVAPLGKMVRALLRNLRQLPGDVWVRAGVRALLGGLLYLSLVALPLLAPAMIVPPSPPLNAWGMRGAILSCLFAPVAVGGVGGIYLIDAAAREHFRRFGAYGPSSGERVVAVHIWLRGYLRRFIRILAALPALIIVETGVQSIAIARWTHQPSGGALLWLYGGYFTALLTLAYLPTHLLLQSYGRQIRDRFCGAVLTEPATEHSQALREYLNEVLGVNIRFPESLRSGLTLIAPLMGAVLTKVVGR